MSMFSAMRARPMLLLLLAFLMLASAPVEQAGAQIFGTPEDDIDAGDPTAQPAAAAPRAPIAPRAAPLPSRRPATAVVEPPADPLPVDDLATTAAGAIAAEAAPDEGDAARGSLDEPPAAPISAETPTAADQSTAAAAPVASVPTAVEDDSLPPAPAGTPIAVEPESVEATARAAEPTEAAVAAVPSVEAAPLDPIEPARAVPEETPEPSPLGPAEILRMACLAPKGDLQVGAAALEAAGFEYEAGSDGFMVFKRGDMAALIGRNTAADVSEEPVVQCTLVVAGLSTEEADRIVLGMLVEAGLLPGDARNVQGTVIRDFATTDPLRGAVLTLSSELAGAILQKPAGGVGLLWWPGS